VALKSALPKPVQPLSQGKECLHSQASRVKPVLYQPGEADWSAKPGGSEEMVRKGRHGWYACLPYVSCCVCFDAAVLLQRGLGA